MKKFLKSNEFIIMMSLLIVIVSSIFVYTYVINKIILSEARFEIASNGPWISYFGAIFSGLISGMITILGVWATITYYMAKDKKEERLKHLPYLRMITTDMTRKKLRIEVKILEDEESTSNSFTNFNITNIGIGPAIDVRVVELYDVNKASQNQVLNLMPKEEGGFVLISDIFGKAILKISIEFRDIHNNTYKQDFVYGYKAEQVMYTTRPILISKK